MELDNIGTPITAEEMRELKPKHNKVILKTLVTEIYNAAITFAKLNSETNFEYFPNNKSFGDIIKFLMENKKDIISNLEKLFPGSRIYYKGYTQEVRINNDFSDAGYPQKWKKRKEKYRDDYIHYGLGTILGLTRKETTGIGITIDWS
jgi:hypothetical protein